MAGTDVEAQSSIMHGIGLVRNADGKPQFNDFNNIPEAFFQLLTEKDWVYIREQQENGDNA